MLLKRKNKQQTSSKITRIDKHCSIINFNFNFNFFFLSLFFRNLFS
jgi:hypothetical protein